MNFNWDITFLAKGIRRFARCGGLRHRSTIPSLAVSAGGIVVLIQIFVNELRGLYCMMQEVYCAAFIGFLGSSLPPPFFFFDCILDSRLATRNPKEHELAKTVEPPICSESVAGDTQNTHPLGSLHFLGSHGRKCLLFLYYYIYIYISTAPEHKHVPKNGTTSQKDISSSNHHFSGDMLVFGRVHTSLLYEDTSLYIYLSVKTLASQISLRPVDILDSKVLLYLLIKENKYK